MKGAIGEFRAVVTKRTEPYHSVTSNLILIYWVGWVYHMDSDFCPNTHTPTQLTEDSRTVVTGTVTSGNEDTCSGWLTSPSPVCWLGLYALLLGLSYLLAVGHLFTCSQGAVLLLSNLDGWHKWPVALLVTPSKSCFLP